MEQIVLIAKQWKARAFIMAQLLEEGYEVMALRTIEEAMRLLAQEMTRPRLIILDTLGQSLSETTLADLRALSGGTPMLLCTGPFDLAWLDLKEAEFADLLVRPFTVGDVVNAVREALGNEAMRNEEVSHENTR